MKQFPYELFPEYYLIKVNKFDDIARNTLDEWVFFLKNGEIKDNFKAPGLKKAKEVLDVLKLSDEERRAYDRYADDLHLQASMVQSTYGVGKLDGFKEGRKEGHIELIKKMLGKGKSPEEVSNLTDVPLQEVLRIAHTKPDKPTPNMVSETSEPFTKAKPRKKTPL